MDDVTVARAIHIVSVVLWIGGVGFVTTVLLPAIRSFKAPDERTAFFHAIERRFAWQARISTALVGVTGLYMLSRLDLWDRFLHGAYWWMHAMVAVWLLFTVILFVREPLIPHLVCATRGRARSNLQACGMAAPNPADRELDHCFRRCRRQSRSPAVWIISRHAGQTAIILRNRASILDPVKASSPDARSEIRDIPLECSSGYGRC